jgi:hypothetical protein
MIDEYEGFQPGLTGPVIAGQPITPNNGADLAFATRGIYVGSTGNLSVVLVNGDQVVLRNVQPGVIYPLRVKRVRSSGTTAGDLVGLR